VLTCRVWARGGLGNQISSLCAGFVATERRAGSVSRLLVDSSIVDRAIDTTRLYQLDKFEWVDSTDRVVISRASCDGPTCHVRSSLCRRGLHSWKRTLGRRGHTIATTASQVGSGKTYRYLDGHFESTRLALTAQALGLRFPTEPVKPSTEYLEAIGHDEYSDVAVHVRLKDYKDWRGGRYVLQPGYYSDAIEALGLAIGSTRITLFSDAPNEAMQTLLQAGATEAMVTVSWLQCPAETMARFSRFPRQVLSHSTFSFFAGVMSPSSRHAFPSPPATMEGLGDWIPIPTGPPQSA